MFRLKAFFGVLKRPDLTPNIFCSYKLMYFGIK